MIEDSRLKVFITVARCGSFSAAARELGITQPAVSQNMAELERQLKVKLFKRYKNTVALTEAGEKLLPHANGILDSYGALERGYIAPKSMLLKNIYHEGKRTDILIKDGRFADLHAPSGTVADHVIEAGNLAILPAFYNVHTHAAMTLLRGYADDMDLDKWLNDYIWPFESKLTEDDIFQGSKLAVEEMVSSGTVFFSDMYFEIHRTVEAVEAAGIRAALGITVMENHSKAQEEAKLKFINDFNDSTGGRISLTIAPHAIYTVGPEKLKRSAALARERGLKLHIHVAETKKEVEDCVREHGTTPVRYLDSLGFLGPDVIAAHCVHVDEEEWKILADRGVTVVHCPDSNMKLGSGRFPYELAIKSGCRITLGTDGASSNNNLDMRETMKFAAFLAKVTGDPTLLPAEEVLKWATKNGAETFGIDAGEIAEGKLADAILVDLDNPKMRPCHNLISNWVYSADSSCISYVLCGGRVVFER